LQAIQTGYLTLAQVDIIKKFLSPVIKNKHSSSLLINLYIKIFPTRILTQKPTQARIGRGKGLPTLWYCKIYKNEIIIEVRNTINQYYCLKLLTLIIKKLPLKIRLIKKKEPKIGSIVTKVIKINPLKNIYIA
jgi:large subunit ribosomal protein L16